MDWKLIYLYDHGLKTHLSLRPWTENSFIFIRRFLFRKLCYFLWKKKKKRSNLKLFLVKHFIQTSPLDSIQAFWFQRFRSFSVKKSPFWNVKKGICDPQYLWNVQPIGLKTSVIAKISHRNHILRRRFQGVFWYYNIYHQNPTKALLEF